MKAVICLAIIITGTLAVLPSYEEALGDSKALLKLFRAQTSGNGKLYSSSEVPIRVGLFRGALKEIVDINNQNLGWTARLNDFATMSHAEKESFLGVNASSIENIPEAPFQESGRRADSVDWVARRAVTPIRQQLGGTCWSYSTIHALEGAYAVTTGSLVEFTTQLLIDCVYPGASLNRGGDPARAMTWIKDNRVVPGWNDYTPVRRVNSCNTRRTNRMTRARVIGYERISASAAALDSALNISPVSTLYNHSKNFWYYGNGLYNDPNCKSSFSDLNHAVTTVGYTRSAFKIKNSWGTGWGNSGYGDWSRRGDCGLLTRNIRVKMASSQEEEE